MTSYNIEEEIDTLPVFTNMAKSLEDYKCDFFWCLEKDKPKKPSNKKVYDISSGNLSLSFVENFNDC